MMRRRRLLSKFDCVPRRVDDEWVSGSFPKIYKGMSSILVIVERQTLFVSCIHSVFNKYV